ncbi:hypothetical protein GQ44DRAFT_808199 [Phaeosphaeriaceae sp. PMI808]|nr:hypothetical protein GQ44DRAFT_808199 [Phaeosphaeriaceae sp. PMI808]
MAEPLSITASILAIISTAEKTSKGLEKLRTLHNALDELEYMLNEINDMRVVLRSMQNVLTALTECEAEDIKGLIQIYQSEVLELDMLVSYHLQAASGYSNDGRPKVNTLGWLSKSGKLSKIRERLRDRRESLVAALVGSLFTISYSHGIRLDIRDISLVSRGEPDQSLVRLDHPQAASMQHALEEFLSRDSYQSYDTLQPFHSDTYQEEEPESGSRQWRRERDALIPHKSPLHYQSVASTRSIRVTTSLAGPSCGTFCKCQCHIHTQVQIPRWLSGILGTMFRSYQGTPALKTRICNYRRCKRSAKTTSHFTYYFLSRLLNLALTFTSTWKDVTGAGGSWHISMPQMISDQHFVWGSHTRSDRGILDLFRTRRASPYIVREGDGYSILFEGLHMTVTDLKSDSLEPILDNDTSSLNKLDNQNKTPLMWAAARGDCEKGTRAYESPLHWALKSDQTAEIVTDLLDYGVDMTSPSGTGAQPLHRAALTGALQSATILLDRGADINAITKPGGDTPLLTAIFWNKPLLVNLFLERRAKLTQLDDGKNILHVAASFCDATVFNILLSFHLPGITAEDTDADGKTAWDIFKQRRDTGSGQKFSSEEEYELNRASLIVRYVKDLVPRRLLGQMSLLLPIAKTLKNSFAEESTLLMKKTY